MSKIILAQNRQQNELKRGTKTVLLFLPPPPFLINPATNSISKALIRVAVRGLQKEEDLISFDFV